MKAWQRGSGFSGGQWFAVDLPLRHPNYVGSIVGVRGKMRARSMQQKDI